MWLVHDCVPFAKMGNSGTSSTINTKESPAHPPSPQISHDFDINNAGQTRATAQKSTALAGAGFPVCGNGGDHGSISEFKR